MRKLVDWIDTYLEYTYNTESATIYHKYTGLSVISACLRKKVWLSIGRINIYSNMYVLLIGPPGGPRKSEAIASGLKFLHEIPDIRLSADAITPEALIQDLESSAVTEPLPDGSEFEHASLTVVSREFESFIGQKGENKKMIITLTDLFSAQTYSILVPSPLPIAEDGIEPLMLSGVVAAKMFRKTLGITLSP